MYNTPTRKNHAGGSPGNRILFRSLGIVITISLLIGALKFASHRQGFAGFICLLFSIFILLFVLIKKNPTAGAWFALLGIVLLALVILGLLEV